MSAYEELEEVQGELLALTTKNVVPPAEKLTKFLRLVRELKIRDSENVARFGSLVLRHHKRSLGDEELWLLHEQVAIAALDRGAIPFAEQLVKAITARFPDSSRTKRLQGMYFEASGKVDTARKLYEGELEENPGNQAMAKRLIALEKTQGNTEKAITQLRKYLEVWSGDREAWEELGEMYLEERMYRQALFCWEELLTFAPTHVFYLIRYADLLYTMGGNAHLRLARAYYSKAVEVSGGANARALYGVLACCANITDKVSVVDSRTRAQVELPNLSAQALLRLYKKHAPAKLPLATAMLEQQGLS